MYQVIIIIFIIIIFIIISGIMRHLECCIRSSTIYGDKSNNVTDLICGINRLYSLSDIKAIIQPEEVSTHKSAKTYAGNVFVTLDFDLLTTK